MTAQFVTHDPTWPHRRMYPQFIAKVAKTMTAEVRLKIGRKEDGTLWERVAVSAQVSETEADYEGEGFDPNARDADQDFDEDAADAARYESRYGQ